MIDFCYQSLYQLFLGSRQKTTNDWSDHKLKGEVPTSFIILFVYFFHLFLVDFFFLFHSYNFYTLVLWKTTNITNLRVRLDLFSYSLNFLSVLFFYSYNFFFLCRTTNDRVGSQIEYWEGGSAGDRFTGNCSQINRLFSQDCHQILGHLKNVGV